MTSARNHHKIIWSTQFRPDSKFSPEGAGGLYTYAGGEIFRTPQSTVYWLTRPRGIHWQADIAPPS
jgi:hypothetical protein